MKLHCVILDCPNVTELAEFYSQLIGWEIADDDGEWASLADPDGGADICFQLDPEYQAPTWPERGRPQMLHLDFKTDDHDAAEALALSLGATRYVHPAETDWRVLIDPAGHPFCFV